MGWILRLARSDFGLVEGQPELNRKASHLKIGRADSADPPRSRRVAMLVPLVFFAGLVALFAVGLTLNPREVPSPLIGKPVPEFELPPVKGRTLGFASSDLRGEVTLVNVFASWCLSCREEHPVFMDLRSRGVIPIHGLNYKDTPDDAAAWLAEMGDPYTRTGADLDGRVAIDWGVYGVPETFVIDREGRIAYKHIGPITRELVREKLAPLIEELRR